MTVAYDPDLVVSIAHTLDLRAPNADALNALAARLEVAPEGAELVADLATGVGKTYIAGALIDYLAAQGVRNMLIVTPGSTIQRKTIGNLTPGHPKHLKGMAANPVVITLDDVETGQVATALEDESQVKVFVLTVQSLLKPDTKDGRRAHRPHEQIGQGLYDYLQGCDDLVVIADEHHIYYSGSAKKFQAAIDDLRPLALVGLTATPHVSSEPKIVYRYPLAAAIADGYVKIPALAGRSDSASDVRTQMADAVALLDAKQAVMNEFCKQTKMPFVQPLLFVVASNIDEANDIAGILAGPDLLGSAERVLVITSEEPDATLAKLDTLEDPDSPYRAVVSVSMLKEGWDNKAIYVIAATRSLESQLLTEQVLGRGLRLPFGHRVGVPMLDTVDVVSHNSFKTLLKEARALLEQTLGEREEITAFAGVTPGVASPAVPVDQVVGSQAASVDFLLPGPHAASQSQISSEQSDGDGHVSMIIAEVGQRLQDADAAAQSLATPLLPRAPGGVRIPLFLPRVSTRWVRDPFTLASINLIDVEALGRKFADDDAPLLIRKLLDAERDADGTVSVVIQDANGDAIVATQTPMPFDMIQMDLVRRLLRTNGITASPSEGRAAEAVAKAFLAGAGVTESTPWRKEHGQLATACLAEWVSGKQTSSPAREVKEVTQVKWPDPQERIEMRPPADRHLIGGSSEFVRAYPYSGWNRAVYAVNSFDAYSTEFRLAEMFETSAGVKAWVRINQTVPLRIAYFEGAIQHDYEPDFLVIDDEGTHWIVEGKSNREMTDPKVLAKADAAKAWVAAVNASSEVQERWGYLMASESAIAAASSWTALKTASQPYT